MVQVLSMRNVDVQAACSVEVAWPEQNAAALSDPHKGDSCGSAVTAVESNACLKCAPLLC